MNEFQRGQIAKTWLTLAEIYGKDLSKPALSLMIDAVSDLDAQSVIQALNNWAKTSKSGRHPHPAEIREAIYPQVDKRSLAVDLARRIEQSIARHGWNWEQGFFHESGNYWEDDKGNRFSSFKEAVVSELGEIGWATIKRRGGWRAIRNSANEMEEANFIAQTRDQIQASLGNSEAGLEVSKLELPTPENSLQKQAQDQIRRLLVQMHQNKISINQGGT